MTEWLSCALWSLGWGLVAGVSVALLHAWWHIGPLRRRCWEAERALAQLRMETRHDAPQP